MKDYDYHRPAEKVLLDSYRKQNRNKNRLLFLAVALTVGVIFCMISLPMGRSRWTSRNISGQME